MDNTPILQVKDLAVNYKIRKGEVNAVRDVSFNIERSQSLGLVGESGCGKSTVAFSIVDFLGRNGKVVHGSILFKGEELIGRSPEELRRIRGSDISMVYQEPMSSLNPSLRIEEQLMETLIAHQGLSKKESRHHCMEMLARVHMPDVESVLQRYPHQLSGGQQQRILIAMAMLNNPALLIMDEPTTALDVTVEAAVLDMIAELKLGYQTATLYITHNLGVVARIADRVAVMYAGEIVEEADTSAIYAAPLHPYTVGLMRCLPDVDAPKGTRQLEPIGGRVPSPKEIPSGCIFGPRCAHYIPACGEAKPPIETIAPGRKVRCIRAHEWLEAPLWARESKLTQAVTESDQTKTVLEGRDLRVYYPVASGPLATILRKKSYVKAVDGVSITVKKSRTVGIVGESGCGKSTIAKAIVGLEPIRNGNLEFLQMDISKIIKERQADIIREMQMVFQDPDGVLNPSFSVGNQIAIALKRFSIVPRNEIYDEVVRLLEAVKLSELYFHRLPRQLSGGEKQRVGIARAIATNPTVLVCDEPVSALDVSVQASILMLLSEIQRQNETAMIVISHDLSSVRYLADYVIVMYLGKIMEEGPGEAIYAPPYHPYTAALLAAIPRPNPDLKPSGFRLSGTVPSAVDPPLGCPFHTRCPVKIGMTCEVQPPPRREMGEGHIIYCHLPKEQLINMTSHGKEIAA